MGDHRGEIRLQFICFFQLNRLSFGLLIELRPLHRNAHLIADRRQEVHLFRPELPLLAAAKLNNPQDFTFRANWNCDERLNPFFS